METPRSSILQGTLDAMGPQHGYGLARRIEQISEDVLLINQGTIYLCLIRLVQNHWISAKWGVSENNRRAKFYSITKAGRRQLQAETSNWERLTGVIGRLLRLSPGT
jgi:PadR family transcriptional regulator PadR